MLKIPPIVAEPIKTVDLYNSMTIVQDMLIDILEKA